jgi:hypothetical protein
MLTSLETVVVVFVLYGLFFLNLRAHRLGQA